MRSILFFDALLTPKIITFVYWLLLIAALVAGLGSMFMGFGGVRFMGILSGIGIIIGGALAARIWCELLMVLFKIEENTRKVANK